MSGIDKVQVETPDPIGLGTRLSFVARGKMREALITEWQPFRHMALTSRQAGVTAVYRYTIVPSKGATRVTLDASCEATGLWRLVHPLIVLLMKRSDGQNLRALSRALIASEYRLS